MLMVTRTEQQLTVLHPTLAGGAGGAGGANNPYLTHISPQVCFLLLLLLLLLGNHLYKK